MVQNLLNIPAQSTPFIQRADELDEITAVLADPTCRLLTLIGVGGVGKTRLALEVASNLAPQFRDGVYFVPLQEIASADYIGSATAEALDIPLYEAGNPTQQLLNAVREKQLLLILDNFEHVLDGAIIVGQILAAAPDVRVIATSREALNVQGEWIRHVEGMPVPASAEAYRAAVKPLETFPAVGLFAQTAHRLRADFSLDAELEYVIRICHLVEGVPLALELAAGWVRALSCREIAQEIERSLDFLETSARNMPPRHRSMRAVMEPTWGAMTPEECGVFKRLSIFRGGFTREAAQTIAGASPRILTSLVDKSMVRVHQGGRYSLHELLRQFAAEKLRLSDAEFSDTAHKHSRYYTDFLHRQGAPLAGSGLKRALNEIETEIENIRIAWANAIHDVDAAAIDRALDSLWFFYDIRGWYKEGERVFGSAAAVFDVEQPDTQVAVVLGKLLARQGSMLFSLNRQSDSREHLERSLALFQQHGERLAAAFSLLRLFEVEAREGGNRTEEYIRQALALYAEAGNRVWTAYCLYSLGMVLYMNCQEDEANRYYAQSLAIYQELDNAWGLSLLYGVETWRALEEGDPQRSLEYGLRTLAICEDIGVLWEIVSTLCDLSVTYLQLGEYENAFGSLHRAIRTGSEYQLYPFVLIALMVLARGLHQAGQVEFAVEVLSLVQHHPNNWERRDEAPAYLKAFETDLPADAYDAAYARGKNQDFLTFTQTLLRDWDTMIGWIPAHMRTQTRIQTSRSNQDVLNDRERGILQLVAAGKSNRDIADELSYSVGTVKWYLNQMYSKLHVSTRTQAIARARELALLQ